MEFVIFGKTLFMKKTRIISKKLIISLVVFNPSSYKIHYKYLN